MGVEGAAIGTLTARVVEVVILVLYIWKKEKNIHLQVRDFFHMDSIMTKDYLKVTLPIAVLSGLWGLNTALQTVILGHMTSAAIAANSAASNLFLMVKSTAVGAASATGIMIGKTIGQGNLERAGIYSKRLQKLFVVIGVMSGSILFFLRIPVLSLYKLSPERWSLPTLSDDSQRGMYDNVLSDAYQQWNHQRRWKYDVCDKNGSDQYLGNRDPAVLYHGICGKSLPGSGGMLP